MIDFDKYLKHVFHETRTTNAMKSSETTNMNMGRMLCMSACVEAKVFISGSQVNSRTIKVILGCLIDLYKTCEFLQESIIAIFAKLLTIT